MGKTFLRTEGAEYPASGDGTSWLTRTPPRISWPRRTSWNPPPLILAFFAMDLLLCLAYGLDLCAGRPIYVLTVKIDLNGEANLPAWYSSIQLFCISLLFGIYAVSQAKTARTKFFLLFILPSIFLFLSLDEAARIHEWIGQKSDDLLPGDTRANTFFKNTGIWMFLLGGPLLGVLGWTGWSLRHQFSVAPRMLPLFTTGILIFMGGALGVEAVSNTASNNSNFYFALVFLEELLEMTGATVILWSSYELLAGMGFFLGWESSVDESAGRLESRPSNVRGRPRNG